MSAGEPYTPSLSGITIGTGGTPQNVGGYAFAGGANVGDDGILSAFGTIQLGTSGFSVTSPVIGLPPGFALTTPAGSFRFGLCYMVAGASGTVHGSMQRISATEIAPVLYVASGTYLSHQAVSGTVPGTWAANNFLTWVATMAVVRT